MKPITILLIEDNQKEATLLKKQLENNNFEIIAIAKTLDQALDYYYTKDFDFVIIDIFLNEEPHGIRFAEVITKNKNSLNPFLFLTSSTSIKVFENAKLTSPSSYLLKPYNELELIFAIQLAFEKFSGATNIFTKQENPSVYFNQRFFIKKNNILYKLLPQDILYVNVEGRYSSIVTKEGSFIVHLSLKEFIKKIDNQHFIRVHRNFIVNLTKIQQVFLQDNLILLENNHRVTISRIHKNKFIKNYDILV